MFFNLVICLFVNYLKKSISFYLYSLTFIILFSYLSNLDYYFNHFVLVSKIITFFDYFNLFIINTNFSYLSNYFFHLHNFLLFLIYTLTINYLNAIFFIYYRFSYNLDITFCFYSYIK
jgi:hypothetical protein